VYSDDAAVRREIRLALGTRVTADGPELIVAEFATAPALVKALDKGVDGRRIDVALLDGEAAPAGGLGIARQIKDEIFRAPATAVIVGRAQDGWLAAWSRCDAVLTHPIDPRAVASAVEGLLAARASAAIVTR
jgi:CheY-like chemotaxis protein